MNNTHKIKNCGYSQGDYIKVNKVGSVDFEHCCLKSEYLENLFFDCPFYGKLEIVEIENVEFYHRAEENVIDEIYLDEYIDCLYSYDKYELLNNFKANYSGIYKAEILEFLQNNLSEDLEYR